jgi:hypothetical protein
MFIHIRWGDIDPKRMVGLRIVDQMQLHTACSAVRGSPRAKLGKRDRGCVDKADHGVAFALQPLRGIPAERGEQLGEHRGASHFRIGIR